MLTPHEEGMTIQVLNKRIQLHYRCPRVPGLEEECRFLKNRVSSNVPQMPPWGLGAWTSLEPRDSDAHSNLRITILVLSDDGNSFVIFTTSGVQLLLLTPSAGELTLRQDKSFQPPMALPTGRSMF